MSKNIRSSRYIVSSVSSLVIALFIGIFMIACQEQENDLIEKKLSYLEFKSGFTGVGDPSPEDMQVVIDAAERIKIFKKDGWFQMNITSPRQANISPEVFRFIENTIKATNDSYLQDPESMRLFPRTRAGGEGYTGPTDCVARCIGYISGQLGYSTDYGSANSWVEEQYGNDGVRASDVSGALSHFFSGVTYVDISKYSSASPGTAILVTFYKDGGHAVVYKGTVSGILFCYDPQRCENVIVELYQVISAYSIQ